MMICNPERKRAAFFMCFCVLVVLLLHTWVNSFSLDIEEYGIVIGIDLGDECARVAYYEDNLEDSAKIVKDETGISCVSPCVAFAGKGDVLVGNAALLQAETNPERTICGFQRLVGRPWSSVQPFIETLPYRVAEGRDAKPVVNVNIGGEEKSYSPEELTGLLLSNLRELAEAHLGKKITHAIVSVPHLDDDQNQAIKYSGARGGLTVLRVVNSYTAAAIGYGLDRGDDEGTAVVYDVGAANLRVTVLEVDAGVFEILHTTSASFDERGVMQINGDMPLDVAMKPLKEALEKTNLTASDISNIILTGSSSHLPELLSLIRDFFNGQEPATNLGDEAVVMGVARIAAAFFAGSSSCCGCGDWQLTHLRLSIETHDGLARVLIPRSSVTPLRRSQSFLTTSEEPSTVAIKIFEGERVFARDNRFIGELRIDEVPPGVPIEVVFEIDAGFMMRTTATVLGGRSVSVNNLNHTAEYDADIIERTIMEAEFMREADHATAEPLAARRDLDSYILAVQKLVEKEPGSSEAAERTVQDAIRDARDWLSHTDGATNAQEIYNQKEILSQALGQLGQNLRYELVYRIGSSVHPEDSIHDEL